MKKFVLIIAVLTFGLGFSQSSKTEVTNDLKTAYNSSDYTAIYDLFSTNYKSKKSLEKVTRYFKRIKNVSGNIVAIKSNEQIEDYTMYKMDFVKKPLTVFLQFDSNNKIEHFSFNSKQ